MHGSRRVNWCWYQRLQCRSALGRRWQRGVARATQRKRISNFFESFRGLALLFVIFPQSVRSMGPALQFRAHLPPKAPSLVR